MKLGLSPLQATANFEETIRECERAEAAGFDSVWLGEHHDNPILHPTPLVRLAAIASRTNRIRLGTGVLLLPLYHPLAVAEEAAMVDVISGGRLILGVGAGYAPEEFAAFDVPINERGSRVDEAVPLIQRLWSEESVTHASDLSDHRDRRSGGRGHGIDSAVHTRRDARADMNRPGRSTGAGRGRRDDAGERSPPSRSVMPCPAPQCRPR